MVKETPPLLVLSPTTSLKSVKQEHVGGNNGKELNHIVIASDSVAIADFTVDLHSSRLLRTSQ